MSWQSTYTFQGANPRRHNHTSFLSSILSPVCSWCLSCASLFYLHRKGESTPLQSPEDIPLLHTSCSSRDPTSSPQHIAYAFLNRLIYLISLLCMLILLCPSYAEAPRPSFSARGEATQGRAEWDNPFPMSGVSAGPDAALDTVCPSGCQGLLPTQIQLAVYQIPQIPSRRPAVQPLIAQSVHRSSSPHHSRSRIQSLLFLIQMVTTVKFVKTLVQGLSALKGVNRSSHLVLSANLIYLQVLYPSH